MDLLLFSAKFVGFLIFCVSHTIFCGVPTHRALGFSSSLAGTGCSWFLQKARICTSQQTACKHSLLHLKFAELLLAGLHPALEVLCLLLVHQALIRQLPIECLYICDLSGHLVSPPSGCHCRVHAEMYSRSYGIYVVTITVLLW